MTNTLQQVRELIKKKIEAELHIEHNSFSERERQFGEYGKIRFQELLSELDSLPSEWIAVTDDYTSSLEKALIFICSAYQKCQDTYRDPKNFKNEEDALHSIMMFPLVQGTMNLIAISRIAKKESYIAGNIFSLVKINNILDSKYPLPLPPSQ